MVSSKWKEKINLPILKNYTSKMINKKIAIKGGKVTTEIGN